MTRIGIIGLGYVGLPLAVAFAEAGDEVLGVERLAWADCVVIATHHRATDLGLVVAGARRVVDLRNAVRQSLGGSPSGPVPANVDVL